MHIVRTPLVRTAVHLEHKMQCVNSFINPLNAKIDLHGLVKYVTILFLPTPKTTRCFHEKYGFG